MPIKEQLLAFAERFGPQPGVELSRRQVFKIAGLIGATSGGLALLDGCAPKMPLASELPPNQEFAEKLRSELGIEGLPDFASMIGPLTERTLGYKDPLWGTKKDYGSILTPSGKSLPLRTDEKGEPLHSDVSKKFDYQRPDKLRTDEIVDGKRKCKVYGTLATIGHIMAKAGIVNKFMVEYFKDAEPDAENVLILNFLPVDQVFTIPEYKLQIGGLNGPRARTRVGRNIKPDGNFSDVKRNVVLLNIHINNLFAADDGFSTVEALTASFANEKTNWAVDDGVKGRDNQDRLVYKGIPYTPDSPQSEAPSTLMGFLALLDPELAKTVLGPSYLEFLNMVSQEMEQMKRNISIVDTVDTEDKEAREVTRRKFILLPLSMALDYITQVIPYISDPRLPTERVTLT